MSPQAADEAAAAGQGISALIVDDEPHVRTFVRMLLRSLGLTEIWEAGDGAQALALYAEHQPTIVLLDVNMPVMSGDQMMRQLLAVDPEAAVVVLTSEASVDRVKQFSELGAMAYVLKHLPRERLREALAEALGCFDAAAE